LEKFKKIIEWLIILAWIPISVYYFYPQNIESLENDFSKITISGDSQWWIILYNNKKIGYSFIKYTPKKDSVSVKDFMFMKINAFGKTQVLYSVIDADLTKELKINNFSFKITNPTGINFSGNGKFENNRLKIKMTTPAGTENINFSVNNRPYLPDVIYRVLMKENLAPGKKYQFPVYDPLLGKEIKGNVEVIEKLTYRFNRMLIPVYKLKFSYSNNEVTTLLSKEFGVIEETSGNGFKSKRVNKKDALTPVEAVNLIWSTAIKSNMKINNKEQIKKISYKLSGLEINKYDLNGDNQSIDEDLLTINKVEIPKSVNSQELKGMKEYLKRTPFIQVNAKPFIKTVNKIITGDPIDTTRQLNHWVYKYLKKESVISVPSALDVYYLKKGDCNEHSILLTALLRTANIPARQSAGVVYQDGYFFYHAWVDVYLGKWIPIDPTFDQMPADVTHIRFINGDLDQQGKVLSLINKLKIEVIDYK